MATNNDDIRWLYGKLKAKGYNIGSEQEFSSSLANEEDRKWYYDKAKGMGLNMGSMDDFNTLYAPVSAQAPSPATEQPQMAEAEPQSAPTATAPVQEQASAPVAQSTPEQPTEPTWQPTEQERIRMQYNMFNMLNDFNQRSKERMERVRRMSEPYSEDGRQRRKAKEFEARMAGVNTKVLGITPPMSQPQGEVQTDTESAAQPQESPRMTQSPVPYGVKYVDGKPVAQWLLPDGSLTTNYLEADQAEYVARTNRQALANNSIDARIKRAESELEGLRQQLNESAARVHNEWAEDYEKNDAPLAAVLAANTYTPRQQSDRENSALRVAIRQKEELLKDLQEERDRQQGKDVGFWRGFGRAMTDFRTWDFGISDLSDAMTMMNAEHYSSPNATEGERKAGREMLKAIYDKQQAEQMYGENVSFWNRAGAMTGEMLPFMVDFALSGGGFEALNVAGKEAARASAKLIGKEALKKISELGVKGYAKKYGVRGVGRMAGNWTIKALGTTADDLLIRAPLMTNTVQGGKTAADIIDRKLGDVVVDENGNYDFTNDKTWGSAVWQGEANAIIENYSEMFGAHLDGVGTAIAEYAKTFGGKRISGMLARVNASGFGRVLETTRKQFQRLGVSDYFGEVAEEYYGQLWRTALNLDDAYTNVPVLDEQGNQVFDEQGNPVYELKNLLYTGQFHGDIWGGMALSMGLMGAGKYTLSGVGYANMKRNVNEADRVASAVFANVDWESLKEAIDNTTNEDMGSLAERIVKDSSLSDEERSAAMVYMERSLNLRGLDLAILAQSRGSEAENGPVTLDDVYSEEEENLTPEQIEARQIHEQGREVYSRFEDGDVAAQADADAIALRMQEAKQGVEDVFGEEDDYYMRLIDRYPWMLVNDPVLTAEQQDAVLYYINAKAALDGVMDASNEATDRKRAEVEHSVGKRTHKDYYVIIPATMKVNDRQVYIVKGDVVMFEDGTAVDVRNSSESVVVMDAATGEYEFTSPDQIFKVSDALNPQDELDVALSVIEQEQMNIFGQNAVAPEEPMVEAQSVPETPESVLNPTENAVAEGEIDAEVDANEESGQQTALSRIPTNEQGEPQFEQAENPEIGWDALVEFSEGDAGTAKEIADAMVEEKRKAYEKAQKQKPRGKTPTEILASKKAIASELAQAEQEYNLWQQMANVEQRRQNAIRSQEEAEARQRAAERAEAEKAEREAREEAERIQREALEGIPEWHMDTPDNARKRGARRFGGEMIVRQEPLQGVVGDEVEVKFSDRDMPKGRAVVIEASQLQPSHIQGSRNPMFFIDEAQPKNRAEEVSMMSAQEIAKGIRPKEITGNATAYTGAPTVNARGEVIQGNNRSDALRYLWGNNLPEQQREYKQYLLDNAEQFGIDRDAVSAMQNPVLVNMLDVEDAEAIRLGQMTSQDTESGGEERIKPQNVALKLGDEMRTFANRLLRTSDEDASFGQLVDRNGAEVLKWMNQIGAISNTQYKSAFDTKGNLTAEAKNDLQKVLYQAVFKGGSKQLEEMFEKLPAKAQRAILSTAFRDMDSPIAGQMLPEIQSSVVAYHELMKDDSFANAKKIEDVLRAVDVFKRTTAFDDRLEQYMPADNFSNFALHLAAMYKANDMSQSTIASYFNQMFDLAQGEKAATLFEEADTTQYPLAEIVKQVLNIDYQPAKNGNNNVANGGADVALRNQNGQRGELRGNESPASGGQASSGAESSERGARAVLPIVERGGQGNIHGTQRPEPSNLPQEETAGLDENGLPFVVSDNGTTTFGVIREESGLPGAPIKLSEGYQDEQGKGYGLRHIEAGHGEEIRKAGFSTVEEFVFYVAKNYDEDNIRVGKQRRNGNTTYLIQVTDSHDNTLFIELSRDGSYWNVNSGGVFRKGYSNKKETVTKTEPQRPNNVVSSGSSLSNDEQSDTSSNEPNGEPTVSERKFSDSVSEKQEKNEESSLQLPDNNEKLASDAYTITPTTYTNKKGKTSDVHLVKFNRELTTEEKGALDSFVREPLAEGKKTSRGWYDRKEGGYMMRSEEAARQLGEMIGNEEAIADAQPMTADELREAVGASRTRNTKPKKAPINRVNVEELMTDLSTKGETTLSEHAEPVKEESKVEHEVSDEEMNSLLQELRDLLGIGDDEGDVNFKFREPSELTAQERQQIQSAGIRVAMGLLSRGTTLFPDYATKMVVLLGDKIRPWLKSFYEGARWTPGYEKYEFTPSEQVATFDVQNFDKQHGDPIAQAAMIVEERKASAVSQQAQKELTEIRNKTRKDNDKQREADTRALAAKAEAVASKAESVAKTSTDERELNRASEEIDRTLDEVNDQLALLGYYEFDEDDSKFHERYGYMLTAEKKAVQDATKLAKQLVNDLGIDLKVTSATTPLGRKNVKKGTAVRANLAPAGGDVTITLPLNEGRELKLYIRLDPVATREALRGGDNLKVENIMYRVEWPDETGRVSFDRMGGNCWAKADTTYSDLLKAIQREAKEYIPKLPTTESKEDTWKRMVEMAESGKSPYTVTEEVEQELAEQRKAQSEYKPGDEVEYSADGKKWEKAKVVEIDNDGVPVLDTGMAPVLYVRGNEGQIRRPKETIFEEAARVAKEAQEKKKENPVEKGWTSKPTSILSTNGNGAKVTIPIRLAKSNLEKVAEEFENVTNPKGFISLISQALGSPTGMRQQSFYYELMHGDNSLLTLRLSNHNVNADNHKGKTPEISIVIKSRRMPNRFYPSDMAVVTEYVYFKEDIAKGDGKILSSIAKDISNLLENGLYSDTSGIAIINRSYDSGVALRRKTAEVKPEQPIGDLFGGLFDVSRENDKLEASKTVSNEKRTDVQPRTGTAERERGHEPRQNESLGASQRNDAKGTDGRGMGGRDIVNSMSDGGRGGSVSRQPKSQSVLERLPESDRKNVRNNHAERGVDYAPKGEDARIKANIEAIELAKRLLEAGETATPEQMDILRKFSGWGGLGKAFNETGYTPNPTAKRLRELLGEQGYQDAVDSRRSAYYTPANVIDAMWDVVRAMGFKGGNVLEGSAGIGNIIGLMPTDMSERSSIHAVEIDSTTGGILSLLYPDAKVEIQGFEKTKVPNGSVDLAITNVPFITGAKVFDETGDKDLSKKFRDIHDFCIAKNVRKLREGGIGIFITSSGTMDNSKELRRWIINEGNADVVGAFRMHNKTFGGTGATSDIIVVRKRVNGKPSPNAIDVTDVTGVRVADYDTGKTRKVKGKETPVINQLSMVYNKYFAEHPENMAGEMMFNFERGETRFPTSRALFPVDGKDQTSMLANWANSFSEMKEEAMAASKVDDEVNRINERLGEGVKEGSIVVNSQGELCMARKGEAVPLGLNKNKVKGHTKAECFEAYSAIKKALSAVLEYQSNHESDEGLTPLLKELNRAFDTFTKTYGNLHKNTAISFLRNDVDFSSILALETYSEKGDKKGNKVITVGKTDIFSRRVIETEKEPQPTTIKDGILASLYKNGGVDVEYIGQALGKSTEEVKREIVESGLGFEDPSTGKMEVSYKYLSGNVREKLHIAQENNEDGKYDANIKALERVMPMNVPAHLIEFTLGSSWIEPKLYEDFVSEKTGIRVKLTNVGGTWYMRTPWSTFNEKNRAMAVVSEKCDKTIMGHELIEAAITNRQITVSKTVKRYDGTTETITDKSATAECGTKVDEIRAEFKDWAREHMQADAEMSAHIEQTYNEQFNNYVPLTIPDEFVPQHFGGQVSELHGKPFALRPHQGRAVVRGTTEPILLAHEVGTGKTYTLITTAMEMRRLGTARKPMIVVQNATVGQFVASAKEIYPNAKVLTIEDCDRTAEGRKNFYAKIKYNDWDMIVVPQSVLELIPDSPEREMAYVKDIIEEKMKVLETMREADSEGKSMIVRQAERELAEQENRLAELTEAMQGRKKKRDEKREATTRHNAEVRALEMLDREVDDVEDFDDMGIDAILVDEAHEYKHLGFATAMGRGVKGVDSSFSKKSQGVYLKVQSVMERNNGRNVVFATGTPISNTAAEIWTFMRYLMPADTMKSYGIYYFDDFVRNFGNIAQMVEFGTNGKFKENNRFAGYVNLPELVRIWSSVADTVLTREAGGVSDKIPDMEGGKPQDLYLPQTRALRSVMKHVKSELEKFEQMSGREKKENSHIPLTMYGIAKAAAIDVRLVMTNAEDDPNNKTNATVRETLRSLKDSAKYKGTVAIFSDNYQNKHSGFNLYEDIRKKLIAEGVPADQIVIIKSGMTIKKKLDIFEKVNAGEIRVIMGSTFTLGTGVNIQERLHTLIHVDAPNRPMDYTQRNGRALRQGNMHKDMNIPVRIIRFGVEDSLDVTAYQRLKTKGAIADSIMNGSKLMQNSMENRVLEEEEDTFGDMTAQLSGSEYAILKNQAEREVRSLTAKQKGHDIDQIYIHNQLPKVEGFIRGAEQRIVLETKNLEVIGKHFPDGSIKKITVGKRTFDNVGSMEEFFKEQNAKMNEAAEAIREGAENYTSKLVLDVDGLKFEVTTTVDRSVDNKGQGTLTFEPERKVTYSCEELGIKDEAVKGNRLKNVMQYIADEIATGKSSRELLSRGEQQLEHYTEEKRQLDARKGAEFPFKQQLEEAKARLAKYEDAMKEELAEKEAKYAEMDKDVEEATDVSYTEEDDEETATNGDGNKYRLVEDRETIDFLDNQPMKSGYRYSQWANHGVLPPMTAKKDGEWRAPMVFDRWEQSEEGMRKANGKADLVQGNGRTTGDVAYNPYFHIRTSPLNDQFTAAYDRPELLVIEGYYPESEETSGYRADGAKDSVGLMDWHSGSVNGQLSDDTKVQTMLSRYFKPRRIVPWSEVADLIMERVGDQQITFPINAVPPMLRAELARRGAKFGSISGSVSEKDIPMLEDLRDRVNRGEWDAGLEKAQAYQDAYDSSAEAKESRVLSLSDKLNTPVKLIRTQEEIDALPNRRQRRAKGWWSENDNSIVIVVPNNVNVADIENTFVHEVVGHKGLRALIGAERFDEFVGEVYDHASVPIRKEIDKATNAMVEAEADRLRVRMAQEHEQAGEDVNSHYYTDMAKARVEAEKKREQYRKEATEEYMADMAGKIGNEGFEKMNREEQTLWGKIKAKVQQFLDKFLQGLKIAKSIKLTDKDLAYILFKSWKNMRGDKGVFAQAEDAVMRYRTGWDKSMESRTAIVEETNKRFNEELQQQIDGTLPEGHVYQLGTPSEVLLSTGVPNLPIQLSAQRLKVKATEYGHDFDFDEIHNLVKELQNPMAVFVYGNKGKMQNIIVGIESNGNQFIVGLSLNPIVQGRALEINSVRNVFPKKNAEWLNWISQGKLLYADKQKIQALIDKQRTILADVEYLDLEDVAKIVENFENPTLEDDKIIRYRDGDDIIAKTPVLARGLYEQRVASTSYQVREALQDSMLGLKEAYLAIEKASGRKQHIEDIAGFENAYLSENRMSSKNHAEQGAFEKLVIKPMLDEVARLAPSESKYAELTEYMMAKHGLERNALMRSNAVADGMDQKAADATDFAGLTGLFATSDVADAEDMARTCVSDYESAHNTDELWNKVNAATKATLSKLKECGLLSAATHDKIANMYDNYIPLRGWAETTADEVYGYLSRNDGNLRGSVLKKAEGRKSVADDPIATIALMGEQAIAQANRNEMKQKFFNYVRRNPSDLVSVNRLWLQRNDVTDEWEPVFASNIKDDDDAATVQQKIDAFEQKMEAMSAAEPDKYKRGRQARGIPYKLGSGAVNEHTMLVKCGDDTYVMTINGNPRAAQALNGLTNPDVGTGVGAALFGLGEKINHAIAPIYTTRNPDFMVSNFLRDALYTNTMTWVKESPRYAARFNANFLRVNPIRMARLVSRYNNNTLDMNDPIERKFHEFIMEGGETGYTNQRDIEKHKKAVKKMLKRANGRISFGKVMDVLAEKWDVLNSAAENCARFAAYLTSLEEGRSIERAIYDAKEISVNFNKKGSGATFMGATGQTKAGNSAAFTSGTGRGLFVFWNAVVQASTNFMRNAERHPFKMAGVLVVPMFLLGAVQAMLGAFDDGDDDDDENNDGRHDYFNQPDYVRRSNILLRVGDQYLAHPLPHEYLAVFGLGEMAATLMMGKEEMSAGEISVEIAKMLSEFSPIPVDRAGWDHALMPSSVKPLYEASINESWTGMPIYKSNPYNENMPEWTKAYSSANHQLVNLAETINRNTGGDAYTKGDIDFNPAQVEYVLNGYFGGYFKIADRMIKMYETATGEREFEWRNMPLANRVVKQGDERTAMRSVNNSFFEYQNEYERIRDRIRSYEKEADNGIFEYAAKLAELSRTPEFHRYWILDGYQSDIRAIDKDLKEATTEAEIEESEKERDKLRAEIVGKLNGTTTIEPADTTGLGKERSYYERQAMQQ